MKKFDAVHAQQVPKPPAPRPDGPPGNIPPVPGPDIPVPDPAPPPLENPGDAPLPPITDPEVVEPGEPNPARPPMRVRGVKREVRNTPLQARPRLKAGADSRNERSNLFPSSELERGIMEATLAAKRRRRHPERIRE